MKHSGYFLHYHLDCFWMMELTFSNVAKKMFCVNNFSN